MCLRRVWLISGSTQAFPRFAWIAFCHPAAPVAVSAARDCLNLERKPRTGLRLSQSKCDILASRRQPKHPVDNPMPEARRGQGARTRLGAKIIFNDRASVIDCVVTNISFSGAELVLADTPGVPNDFELYIPTKCCSYRARLVWRDADGVGVEFYRDSKRRH